MKVLRKIIEIDEELCDGCGACVPNCAEGALQIVDGKAKVVADVFCDGLGACLGECPNDALHIVEREAEEFDEKAVETYLSEKEKAEKDKAPATLPCGCPSTHIQSFVPASSCQSANKPAGITGMEGSALSHWPIQIKLIPANAPFLKGSDILVIADCVAVAYPNLHRDLIKGKVVMMGCPKFDEVQAYESKFADIFKTAGVKSVTVAVMEVPCCAGMPMIVKKGMKAAGKEIPMTELVITAKGKIL
ncbi:MAG: 4Fe-4S ferredoxin [Desulfobacteraceae bacterium IS3]|nr:MAG: 4Fe-4S ferredoxin [Desulfobacteraceae bacterium IS3]